jgi:hypothetical protein
MAVKWFIPVNIKGCPAWWVLRSRIALFCMIEYTIGTSYSSTGETDIMLLSGSGIQ